MPALYAAKAGYDVIEEVGVDAIRRRSLDLTDHLIRLADRAGFEVTSQRDQSRRGASVTIRMPGFEGVHKELSERQILCDFRPEVGLRLGPHFFNTAEELDLRSRADRGHPRLRRARAPPGRGRAFLTRVCGDEALDGRSHPAGAGDERDPVLCARDDHELLVRAGIGGIHRLGVRRVDPALVHFCRPRTAPAPRACFAAAIASCRKVPGAERLTRPSTGGVIAAPAATTAFAPSDAPTRSTLRAPRLRASFAAATTSRS